MVWYGMVWHGMAWHGMVWYGMVWYGMIWYGMVWYGMVWYAYDAQSLWFNPCMRIYTIYNVHLSHSLIRARRYVFSSWRQQLSSIHPNSSPVSASVAIDSQTLISGRSASEELIWDVFGGQMFLCNNGLHSEPACSLTQSTYLPATCTFPTTFCLLHNLCCYS